MKIDYKNWVPMGLIKGVASAAAACTIACAASLCLIRGGFRLPVAFITGAGALGCAYSAARLKVMYDAFDYRGETRLAEKIIRGVSAYVTLPDGGTGLDVGCGSGALTIACAKRFPHAKMVGVDRWGSEYASFSKVLYEKNAIGENARNVSFHKGDAKKLAYGDGTFDAVTSNYVYHNIPSRNRQALLGETLWCLKKGGCFAIHDLFTRGKYGDMEAFAEKLRAEGFEKVVLADTTDGMFMTKKEARLLGLSGSKILYGIK